MKSIFVVLMVTMASHNEIDILESIDFQSLRELIEKMK